jgi:hypothetical protein
MAVIRSYILLKVFYGIFLTVLIGIIMLAVACVFNENTRIFIGYFLLASGYFPHEDTRIHLLASSEKLFENSVSKTVEEGYLYTWEDSSVYRVRSDPWRIEENIIIPGIIDIISDREEQVFAVLRTVKDNINTSVENKKVLIEIRDKFWQLQKEIAHPDEIICCCWGKEDGYLYFVAQSHSVNEDHRSRFLYRTRVESTTCEQLFELPEDQGRSPLFSTPNCLFIQDEITGFNIMQLGQNQPSQWIPGQCVFIVGDNKIVILDQGGSTTKPGTVRTLEIASFQVISTIEIQDLFPYGTCLTPNLVALQVFPLSGSPRSSPRLHFLDTNSGVLLDTRLYTPMHIHFFQHLDPPG